MDAAGPPSPQQPLAQGQGQGHLLVVGISGGDHVLQVPPAGEARGPDQGQKRAKVVSPQGLHLLLHPPILLVDVDGPQRGPVPGLPAQHRQGRVKLALRNLPENALAEVGADLPQLPGYGGVFVRQIRVVRAAVDDAQSMAGGGEVEVHPLHRRVGVVLEINRHHAAHRGPHLVQQAAGLAEIDVLRVLADLSQLDGGAPPLKEQAVDDVPHQHLKGRAGAEAAALEDIGRDVGVEPLHAATLALEPGCGAPDDGHGGVHLLRPHLQLVQVHLGHGESLALDADGPVPAGGHGGNHVQIHTARQHPSVLVVRVVAADLRAAGGGEHRHLLAGAEGLLQAPEQAPVPLRLPGGLGLAVEAGNGSLQLCKIFHGRKWVVHSCLLKIIWIAMFYCLHYRIAPPG